MKLPDINFRKMNNMTMTVTYHFSHEWKIRSWIAVKLIVIAARIMGISDIEFVEAEKEVVN